MGKPSKKEKYSATYCWIRWTNLYPVPYPQPSCPGPGRKRRRSLAGGLVWVLLGLVWLGSPFIIRVSECSTDVIKADNDKTVDKNPTTHASYERSYQLNLVQSDSTYYKRRSNQLQQNQRDSLTNPLQHYHHHHHLHHPVQVINSNVLQSDLNTMVNGNEVIQKTPNAECPNCVNGLNDFETKAKLNKMRPRFQSSKSEFKMSAPTLKSINTDSLRLEAIKHQILSKLGLKAKPNITHEFSKQTILNTLSRADDMNWQNDEIEQNTRNYYNYFKFIDRHLFDSNSINTNNNIINHYDFVTSKNHITNNMNATYRDSTFTKNHIIKDNDRINNDNHKNKNLMDSKSNTNYNPKHHITQKHQTSYHPTKSKNHICSQPDKHKSITSKIPLNHKNHNQPNLKVQRNRTTINEQQDFYKINNFSDISDHSDNNLLFVNEDDSYHIDGQLLQRHELHQQPEQLNQPPDNIDADQDDYFGRTREVITFAEQGEKF